MWFPEGTGNFQPIYQASHPQMINLEKGTRLIVWEEASAPEKHQLAGTTASHKHGAPHVQASAGSKIILRIEREDKNVQTLTVSEVEKGGGTKPVVIGIGNEKVLIAWTRQEK